MHSAPPRHSPISPPKASRSWCARRVSALSLRPSCTMRARRRDTSPSTILDFKQRTNVRVPLARPHSTHGHHREERLRRVSLRRHPAGVAGPQRGPRCRFAHLAPLDARDEAARHSRVVTDHGISALSPELPALHAGEVRWPPPPSLTRIRYGDQRFSQPSSANNSAAPSPSASPSPAPVRTFRHCAPSLTVLVAQSFR